MKYFLSNQFFFSLILITNILYSSRPIPTSYIAFKTSGFQSWYQIIHRVVSSATVLARSHDTLLSLHTEQATTTEQEYVNNNVFSVMEV